MRICITGDILFHKPIIDMCKTEDGYDFTSCLSNVIPYFEGCDLVIANPETPFAGEELGYTSERYCFNTPTKALQDLKSVGIGMVTLANNHAMDRDYAGLLATVKNCEDVGMEYIGVSAGERNAVKIKDLGGKRIAFVNATYGTNAFSHHNFLPDDKKLSAIAMTQPEEDLAGAMHLLEPNERISQEVEELYGNGNPQAEPFLNELGKDIKYAKEHSDFTIMLLHSGGQYNAETEAYTRLLCEKIKKMGADMIVTNHPHIILPSELDQNGIFTAYCLGNLQAAFPHDPKVSLVNREYSALLYLTFDGEAAYPEISFSIMRCVISDNRPPMVYNAYDYYRITGDVQTRDDMIAFANRFMPNREYCSAEKEYKI